MTVAISTLMVTAATTSSAFAANGAPVHGTGVLCWACIGFFAAILVGQTIPAVRLAIRAKGLPTPPSAASH